MTGAAGYSPPLPGAPARPRRLGTPRGAGAVGFLVGLLAAALALAAWRLPPADGELGLEVRLAARASGELAPDRTEPFLVAERLMPGVQAGGSVVVRNQTGARLAVRVRALGRYRDADDHLVLELSAQGTTLARDRLGALRRVSRGSFALPAGAAERITARAWIPEGSGDGASGQVADVGLEFVARPVEA